MHDPAHRWCDGKRAMQLIAHFANVENILKLQSEQRCVDPVTRNERGMIAKFHKPSTVEDGNLVGIHDRRQPVRDDDRRAPCRKPLEGLSDLGLRLRIERTCRLIQQQDGGVSQERARNRKSLPLAAGEPVTANTDYGVVSLRQRLDEVVRGG